MLQDIAVREACSGGQVLLQREDLVVVRRGTARADIAVIRSTLGRSGVDLLILTIHLSLTVLTLGLWLIPWVLWWLLRTGSRRRNRYAWDAHMQRLDEDRFRICEITIGEYGQPVIRELRGKQLQYAIDYFNVDPKRKAV